MVFVFGVGCIEAQGFFRLSLDILAPAAWVSAVKAGKVR
jgi:hypothetical protein